MRRTYHAVLRLGNDSGPAFPTSAYCLLPTAYCLLLSLCPLWLKASFPGAVIDGGAPRIGAPRIGVRPAIFAIRTPDIRPVGARCLYPLTARRYNNSSLLERRAQ